LRAILVLVFPAVSPFLTAVTWGYLMVLGVFGTRFVVGTCVKMTHPLHVVYRFVVGTTCGVQLRRLPPVLSEVPV